MPGTTEGDLQDPRWELVQRIIASPSFARSEQLSKLLSYVSRMAILERFEEINEQSIGVGVFGRSPDYDSAADSIVRSHATRLRQKLELYFRGSGRNEPLRIDVPRGGYVPRFYTAASVTAVLPEQSEDGVQDAEPDEVETPAVPPEAQHALPEEVWLAAEDGEPKPKGIPRRSQLLRGIAAGFAVVALFFTAALAIRHLRHDQELATGPAGIRQTPIEKRFWKTLFPGRGRTIIVPGDAGLILFETLTNHEVSLEDYISGSYCSRDYMKGLTSEISPELTVDISTRRYTSVAYEEAAERLAHLPQWSAAHASTVFAQDLKLEDAKTSNLVLLGSRQSNPWATLMEPSLNFVLISDGKRGFQYLNRKPLPGESDIYGFRPESGGAGGSDIYAHIAYLPNPAGTGMVLILSGMWSTGTQAATAFVLDSPRFSAWLKSITRPDNTIPPFELLLATKSIEGSTMSPDVVAKRVRGR